MGQSVFQFPFIFHHVARRCNVSIFAFIHARPVTVTLHLHSSNSWTWHAAVQGWKPGRIECKRVKNDSNKYYMTEGNVFKMSASASVNSVNPNWLLLPDLLFNGIMLLLGLEDFEILDRCRQVCKLWNVMIMRNLWENPSKSWGSVMRTRIENCWNIRGSYPSDKHISHALMLGKWNIMMSNQECN